MSSSTDQEREDSFEERLNKLESIVNLLENETPPLEEALNSYEKGVEIAKACLNNLS